MKKVITYGTFDLLHQGHINLLERAKKLGDYLIVGITSDAYDRVRGKINNQQTLMERVAAVESTGLADQIIIEEYEGQKINDISSYCVDVFTVGSDWTGKFDYLSEYCEVVYLPRTEGISSSKIRTNNRKIDIGVIGNFSFIDKFINELLFVNGVQYRECTDDYNEVDAVYIASMPENHYNQVKKALQLGKHVICESPIALKTSECTELYKLAKSKNLVLYDSIKTAYSLAFSRLIVLAKSGIIGDIVSVDSVCTSLKYDFGKKENIDNTQSTICAWGPIALLPIFSILGTDYKRLTIASKLIDEEKNYDGFTKMDFIYNHAVASIKIAKSAKSEGELIITGSRGYIYVPAPWWKTEYFEVRFEDSANNKRYFYQLDGEGIRNEIVSFVKDIESKTSSCDVDEDVSINIVKIVEQFEKKENIYYI